MAEMESPRLTCGSIVLAGVLALTVVVALQRQTQSVTWTATAAAAIAVVSIFLVARGVHHFGWGVVAAALLTFHPAWKAQSDAPAEEVLGGAMVLAVVAGAGIGWRLAVHPRFAWRSWPVLAGAMALAIGLAWKADPHLGFLAAAVTALSLGEAALLASQLRQRNPLIVPSRLNFVTGAALAVLTPLAGLVVYRFVNRTLFGMEHWWELLKEANPSSLRVSLAAFDSANLRNWCWPHPVLVLPFALFALLMNARRGWRQWSKGEAPTAWFLSFFVLVMLGGLLLLPTQGAAMQVILTAVVALLATSMTADVLRHVVERLMLRPPDEREAEGAVRKPEQTPAPVADVASP
jgi:hypothetical protein